MAISPADGSLAAAISPEKGVLAADILKDLALAALSHVGDSAVVIADAYNKAASPAYWVWRTTLFVQELYEIVTDEGTTWSWDAYIARSPAERDSWRDRIATGVLNPSLPHVREALLALFVGSDALSVAQRAHILAVSRRQARRAEVLVATGKGTQLEPSLLVGEVVLDYQYVLADWEA